MPPKITAKNSTGSRSSNAGALAFPALVRLGQRLSIDDADHLVDPGSDAARVVAALELRRDDVRDDALGNEIGQRALETAAHSMRSSRSSLATSSSAPSSGSAAQLPGIDDADRVLLDFLGPFVVATTSTAICAPLRASNSASFDSSAAC
jgi:hypothetical protein